MTGRDSVVSTNPDRRLQLAIGIATTGRREILKAVVPHIVRQTRLPDEIVICAANEDDVDVESLRELAVPARVLFSERGLCRQRNRILADLPGAGILLFLDDDFLMAPCYLEEAERIFRENPDVVMSTGTVDADGITGPGIAISEGLEIISRVGDIVHSSAAGPAPVYNAYGCNMAMRMEVVRSEKLSFDENLPLYGWLEDVDFSRQMAPYGKIVRSGRLRGVHLGTKLGRTSGIRFGYSQIANPIYLSHKKTMSFRRAFVQIARNIIANTIKLASPEPWVDRRGRFRGNLRAIADLVRGRLGPQNVTAME